MRPAVCTSWGMICGRDGVILVWGGGSLLGKGPGGSMDMGCAWVRAQGMCTNQSCWKVVLWGQRGNLAVTPGLSVVWIPLTLELQGPVAPPAAVFSPWNRESVEPMGCFIPSLGPPLPDHILGTQDLNFLFRN